MEHHLAALLAGTRTHVDDPVRRAHDLRVVLDHQQGVARRPQLVQHRDDAGDVARVQPDARLVEHEQGVHQRGAQRGGQVDALDLAAGEGARLAVQGEVAEADVGEVAEAGADLGQEQPGGFVEGGAQAQPVEEGPAAVERQAHHVVDAQPRLAGEGAFVEGRFGRAVRGCAPERAPRLRAGAHPPQQRLGLEPRPAARRALPVGPVAREQHPHVHPVALGLQPVEEPAHPVPPALVEVRLAFQHPFAGRGVELAPRAVERHLAPARVALQVALALAVALRLPRAHRPFAERLRLVGDHEPVVDAHRAPEAAAGLAGAERGVERERARGRLPVFDVAAGAVQGGGEASRRAGAALGVEPVDGEAAPSRLQGALDGLGGAGVADGARRLFSREDAVAGGTTITGESTFAVGSTSAGAGAVTGTSPSIEADAFGGVGVSAGARLLAGMIPCIEVDAFAGAGGAVTGTSPSTEVGAHFGGGALAEAGVPVGTALLTGTSLPTKVGALARTTVSAGTSTPTIAEPEAVLDDLDAVRVLAVHPGVALAREQPDDLARGRPLGHRDLEGHHHPVEAGGAQRVQDRAWRVAAHRRAAAAAVQDGGAGEQQLQVVVELGHGADGGARGPHRIGLVDGDGRGDAVDGVHAGLVHAVEELAGVGGEGLDVAALTFAVDGVEGER